MVVVAAAALAALITLGGAWAFMASIHSQSTLLNVFVVVALPLASLASIVGFLDSDIVYWVSILAGFMIWAVILYTLIARLGPGGSSP
jgi:hypothetical protein